MDVEYLVRIHLTWGVLGKPADPAIGCFPNMKMVPPPAAHLESRPE